LIAIENNSLDHDEYHRWSIRVLTTIHSQSQNSIIAKPTFVPIIIAHIQLIMKLTVPEMDALSDNGFPIFKPMEIHGASLPRTEEGPPGICILGNCIEGVLATPCNLVQSRSTKIPKRRRVTMEYFYWFN
jgi:hypothetical protein